MNKSFQADSSRSRRASRASPASDAGRGLRPAGQRVSAGTGRNPAAVGSARVTPPPALAWKLRPIAGRPMFTIEPSSEVMKLPAATTPTIAQRFAATGVATGAATAAATGAASGARLAGPADGVPGPSDVALPPVIATPVVLPPASPTAVVRRPASRVSRATYLSGMSARAGVRREPGRAGDASCACGLARRG